MAGTSRDVQPLAAAMPATVEGPASRQRNKCGRRWQQQHVQAQQFDWVQGLPPGTLHCTTLLAGRAGGSPCAPNCSSRLLELLYALNFDLHTSHHKLVLGAQLGPPARTAWPQCPAQPCCSCRGSSSTMPAPAAPHLLCWRLRPAAAPCVRSLPACPGPAAAAGGPPAPQRSTQIGWALWPAPA